MDNLLSDYGVSIGSTLVYNRADMNYFEGLVTSVTVNFFQPFDPEATTDGFLWLIVVSFQKEARALYPLTPLTGTDTSLLQSFPLDQSALAIYRGEYLAVGTFVRENTSVVNRLCALDGGVSIRAPMMSNLTNMRTIEKRRIEQIGVAFSYRVLREGEFTFSRTIFCTKKQLSSTFPSENYDTGWRLRLVLLSLHGHNAISDVPDFFNL